MLQILYTPIAIDEATLDTGAKFPGKAFEYEEDATKLGKNKRVSVELALRTTDEGPGSIRPLIDANIRSMYGNPKWDSGLGLPALAAYVVGGESQLSDTGIQMKTSADNSGSTYWGSTRTATGNFDKVVLFDVPREDLVSLGQLQHANSGRFSYEPTYIAGNSYRNIRISQTDWKDSVTDTFSSSQPRANIWSISGSFNLYDASFLVNEAMWDSFTFTTIPQVADNFSGSDVPSDFPALLKGDILLPNPRFTPYEPEGMTFDGASLKDEGNADKGSFFHNAGFLLVDGSFNIHSTSVDAWEAFLSGTQSLPVQKLNNNGGITGYDSGITKVRFPRVKSNLGDGYETGDGDSDFWTGFRELTQAEVRDLATEIVAQNRLRGPYHGLGEFVNRRLKSGPTGLSGPLQAALDATVNSGTNPLSSEATNGKISGSNPQQASGFPGQLLQGDILQALGPYMSARSDTFTIRAYGEAVDPNDPTKVLASAWCEAVVQRIPDPVSPSTTVSDTNAELANPSSPFGRQFVIKTFRWLSREEV